MGIFRRPAKQVRMQLVAAGRELTIEGVLVDPRPRAGVYRLADASILENTSRTHGVGTVSIPACNVLFWQELTVAAATPVSELVERS